MNETKKWIMFSVILVFITGFLAGTLLGLFMGKRSMFREPGPRFMEHRMDLSKPPEPEQMREMFVKRITEDVSLTPDQVKKLRKIMETNEKGLTSFRTDMKDRMEKMRLDMSKQIKEILTPEQRKKFEAIEKKMEARFEKGEFGPPDGHHGEGFGMPGGRPGFPGDELQRDGKTTDTFRR